MADATEVLTAVLPKIQQLHDDVSTALGQPTTAQVLSDKDAQIAAANAATSSKQQELAAALEKIANAKIAAQAVKDRDAANVEGQEVLDALQ